MHPLPLFLTGLATSVVEFLLFGHNTFQTEDVSNKVFQERSLISSEAADGGLGLAAVF